ncbi:CBS domain-containing protein [Kangiella sp. HD9-110m-PIT-SAG06]|nr:CBS domain-containing protein [Kangiella sp. HD9-110m-PIT-SAG06]RDX36773.1 CBS domain-containing protein [Kangiella sp. HD9-110m-PIT-SAG07]
MTLIDRLRLRLGGFDALALMAVIGLICGVLAGGSNILFRYFTESSYVLWATDQSGNTDFENADWLLKLLLPTIGGLIVGLLLQQLNPDTRRVGVSHVLERMAHHQGHLPLKNAIVQFFLGGLTIASGQSVGREGPGIHLGSTTGSLIGQRLKLPNNSTRILVGCGCAAAISANFNTPLAGVVFAMEIVMMEYAVASFIPIILASVAGAVMSRMFFGSDPAFIIPASMDIQSLWEMPYFLLLGFICGIIASLFIMFTSVVRRGSKDWPVWIKTTVGGTCVGIIALAVPQVMGIGYDTVNSSLQGELLLTILGLSLAGKFIATSICSGLSMPGGVLGPTLFMGAMLGGLLGTLGSLVFPNLSSDTGFYAIIGMATLMSAVLQAPLAGLMALLELTNNPNIILPGMFSIVIGNLVVSQLFKRESYWETQMKDRGMRLKVSPMKQVLRSIGVAGVMTRSIAFLKEESTQQEISMALQDKPRWILIQDHAGEVISLMVASDLGRYLIEQEEELERKKSKVKAKDDEGADETQNVPEQSPEEELDDDTSEQPIKLMEIPANRQDIVAIDLQATLEEAYDKMEQRKISAAYVYRITHNKEERIYGIVTRGMITDQYIFSKAQTG